MWIARDLDSKLYLYNNKPLKATIRDKGYHIPQGEKKGYTVSKELFPEVTFENSPLEIEIKINILK